MTISPSDAPITVTSNADARCWDVFAVIWCRLNVEIQSTGGQQTVSGVTAPTGSQPAAAEDRRGQRVVGDHNAESNSKITKTQQLTERLTTLRDLYNQKLISTEVYDQETKKAIKALGE